MRTFKETPSKPQLDAKDLARLRSLIGDALQLIGDDAELERAREELHLALDAIERLQRPN